MLEFDEICTLDTLGHFLFLQQRYSFLQALRQRDSCVGRVLTKFNIGSLKCLLCEDTANDLKQCDNEECRMFYCRLCWVEIGVSTCVFRHQYTYTLMTF